VAYAVEGITDDSRLDTSVSGSFTFDYETDSKPQADNTIDNSGEEPLDAIYKDTSENPFGTGGGGGNQAEKLRNLRDQHLLQLSW